MPALLLEQGGCPVAVLTQVEPDAGAVPFGWAASGLPADQPSRVQLGDLHVEPDRVLDDAAEAGVPGGLLDPPAGQAVQRGERVVDLVRSRSLDPDVVQDVCRCPVLLVFIRVAELFLALVAGLSPIASAISWI